MASKVGSFDLAKPGKFKVSVGKSLRRSDDESVPDSYSNVQYNVGYEGIVDGLDGSIDSQLESNADGQYSLQFKGSDDATIAKYAGSQRAARKLECVLIYSPDTNSFTLERLASTFTFNREIPETDEAPLSASATIDNTGKHHWKVEDPLVEDAEEMTADVENPYDVRHFLQKPKEESGESEDVSDSEEPESDDDFEKTSKDSSAPQIESVATPGVEKVLTPTPQTVAPTSAPKPKPLPKKPKKTTDPFMPREKTKPRPLGRSPLPGSAAFAGRQGHHDIRDSSMSPSSALPSPAHFGLPRSLNPYPAKPTRQDSASESDSSSSDEDDESDNDTHRRSLQPATNMSRQPSGTGSLLSRNEPDVFVLDVPKIQQKARHEVSDDDADGEDDDLDLDLEAEMEQEFGSRDDSIVMEGDSMNLVPRGLGIDNVNAGGPVTSLSSIVNGSRRDESEESSSEEE